MIRMNKTNISCYIEILNYHINSTRDAVRATLLVVVRVWENMVARRLLDFAWGNLPYIYIFFSSDDWIMYVRCYMLAKLASFS